MAIGKGPSGRFAPDPLSVAYDYPVGLFLGQVLSGMTDLVTAPLGSITVASPPGAGPDNVAGSDLNVYERAWLRAAYRWQRENAPGLSLRIFWGRRVYRGALGRFVPEGAGGFLRTVEVEFSPKTRAAPGRSYVLNPGLRAFYR